MFDCIIRNGNIVDGTGRCPFTADIAIKNGVVSSIARDLSGTGRNEIDAAGLLVAPGFIDIHSHSDISLFFDPHAESKIRQGVTTEVIGQCGVTGAPVRARHKAALLRLFEKSNFAMTTAEKEAWNWPSQMAYLNDLVEKGVSVVSWVRVSLCIVSLGGDSHTIGRDHRVRVLHYNLYILFRHRWHHHLDASLLNGK